MESLRFKTVKKLHKWKPNSFKIKTLSRRSVSLSTVPSSSSSFPDYSHTEVFANAEMSVDVGPIKPFPSNDNEDHHHHHLIAIPAAATSNPVDNQMIISSSVSELSAFQKHEVSKVTLTWVVPACMFLMSTNSSALEAKSKFIYLGPAPAPEHQSKSPEWIFASLTCIFFCGGSLSLIGMLLSKTFALLGLVMEVFGFLLIVLGVVGLLSSVLNGFLMWLPWLSYFLIIITILLDQFYKLAVPKRATLLP